MIGEVSASQIDLFRKCPRKWAWAYIEGFREEPTESTELGGRVHKILEGYLRDGTKIDGTTHEGSIAQAGLPFLPEPGTGLVEEYFRIPSGEVILHGYIDWHGSYVLDHKTTSDFRWAKTPEDLSSDTQSILYGSWALGSAAEISARWLYYRTKGKPQARPVDTVLGRDHLTTGLAVLVDEAHLLTRLRKDRADPLSLPANPQHCFAYQKLCHNAHRCNLTTLQRIQKMQPIGKDQLLEQLKLKAQGAVAITAPSTSLPGLPGLPGIPAPPTGLPAQVAAPADQIALLQAQIIALSAPPVLTPVPLALPPAAAPLAIVAPLPPPAAVALPPVTPAAPVLSVALPAPAPALLAPAPEAKKRGRPKGSKNVSAPSASGKPIGVLYVNCIPMCEEIGLANDLFVEAHGAITAAGFGHYKTIEFGKGPAVFAQCVGEAAKKDPGDYYVDSMTNEGSDALETLVSLADRVVRSV